MRLPNRFERGYTPELVARLLRGDLDLAIVDTPPGERGLHQVLLLTDRLAIASLTNIAFPHANIPLKNLTGTPLVLLSPVVDPSPPAIEQALKSSGNRPFKDPRCPESDRSAGPGCTRRSGRNHSPVLDPLLSARSHLQTTLRSDS